MRFSIEPDEGYPPSELLPLTLIVIPAKASDPAGGLLSWTLTFVRVTKKIKEGDKLSS